METNLPINWKPVDFYTLSEKKPLYKLGKILQKEYKVSGKYPVIDQGKEFISGYSDNKDLVYTGKLPVILFGDHTLITKYVDFMFVQGADGLKVIIPNRNIYGRFLLHLIDVFKPIDNKYSRHFKKLKQNNYPMPFKDGQPDFEEQKRIADKIDYLSSEINKGIEKTEFAIENTQMLLQSELNKIFSV